MRNCGNNADDVIQIGNGVSKGLEKAERLSFNSRCVR